MEFKVTIKPDGEVLHEVLARGEQKCSDIHKVTIGTVISDEEIGPDCEPVLETTRDN